MEPYLGEVRIFAGNFAPVGWQLCNGQTLPISQYDALYTLLGTTYGGDGQNTFGLPDLRGRVLLNQGQGIGSPNNYTMGSNGGVESVTLVTSNLPAHNHTFIASTANGDNPLPSNNFLATPIDPTPAPNTKTITLYIPDTAPETVQALLPNTLTPVGGSQPHENRMPYLTVNYIIATQGIFPSFQ
jgi:microcystin-dependent protein